MVQTEREAAPQSAKAFCAQTLNSQLSTLNHAHVVQFIHDRIDGPATGDVIISPITGVVYCMLHRRGRFCGGVHVTNGAGICREGGWESSGWLGMRSSALLEDAERGSSREVIINVALYLIQCDRVPLSLGHAVAKASMNEGHGSHEIFRII
jgi:hypothetical protein